MDQQPKISSLQNSKDNINAMMDLLLSKKRAGMMTKEKRKIVGGHMSNQN